MKKIKGFTLIELLIVIGIIAILAAIIYVAVDPARRLQEARDAERWASVNAILNAVLKFTVDNSGTLPAGLGNASSGIYYVLGAGVSGSCLNANCGALVNSEDCMNLDTQLVDEYISAIPQDPSSGTINNTDYYIMKSSNGRITVGACDPERATSISVSR